MVKTLKYIRSRSRTTKWNLLFNNFSVLYAIVSGILLVPMYLHFLPIKLYGSWLAVSNVVAWITIIDPGLSTVVMQRVSSAYGQHNQKVLSGLIANSLLLSALLSVFVLVIGFAFSPYLFSLLNLSGIEGLEGLRTAFDMAVIGTALMILSYGITAVNQGLQSSLGIGSIFVIVSISGLILTVLMLTYGYGIWAMSLPIILRGFGLVLGNSGYLIWRLYSEKIHIKFQFEEMRELASLLTYTFWGKAVGGIANNFDALVVTRFLGPEFAPVLILTSKASELSRTFLERPAMAFMPAVANLYGEGDVKLASQILIRLLRIIIWLCGLAAVGLFFLNQSFVSLWVGDKFYAGGAVNAAIVVGTVILVMTSTLSSFCFALGNIKGNSIALLCQSLMRIPLVLIGVHFLGMFGITSAPILASLAVAVWYYSKTFSRMLKLSSVEVRNILSELFYAFLAALVVFPVASYLNPGSWFIFVAVMCLVIVTYNLALFSTSASFRNEISLLRKFFLLKFKSISG